MTQDCEPWERDNAISRQQVLTWGAILGSIMAILTLILCCLELAFSNWTLLPPSILLIGLFYAMKSISTQLRHFVFLKAFTVGLSISFYASLFVGVIWYLYTAVFNPDFINDFIAHAEINLLQLVPQDASQEAEDLKQMVTSNILIAKEKTTPFSFSLGKLLDSVLWGGLVSIVAGAFFRDRNPQSDSLSESSNNPLN